MSPSPKLTDSAPSEIRPKKPLIPLVPITDATPSDANNPTTPGQRPDYLPEKFWDKNNARPRLEEMTKSYNALERKLSKVVAPDDPGQDLGDAKDHNEEDRDAKDHNAKDHNEEDRLIGVPEKAEDYHVTVDGKDIEIEEDVRATLHREGFTQKQVGTMYHLAQEHLMPMVSEMTEQMQSERDVENLKEHFGGEERWDQVSSQIRTWAKSHLKPEIFELLSTNYEGVLALSAMMHSREPKLFSPNPTGESEISESYLRTLIASPAYWKDRDPETIRKVAEGYARLYPNK